MNLLTVILVISMIGSSYQALFNVNKMVDKQLLKVRTKAHEDGKELMTIPDITKEWQEKIARFIKVKCHLKCEGGWVKNISTIRRVGDVTLKTLDDKFTLNFKLGFDDFAAHYDSCRFEANRIGRMTHKVEISTSQIVIDGQATLLHDGTNCKLNVDHVFVDNMGDLNFDTGGSFFQRVESKILEYLAEHFNKEVKELISKNLERRIRDAIEEADVCDKLPF